MEPFILIVEDCEETLAALEIAVERYFRCRVEHARTGTAAVEAFACEDRTILAMITDLNLPELDGWELIRQIRLDPRGRELPILAVSAEPNPLAQKGAIAAGADAFIGKPYSPLELCRCLEKILYAKQKLDSAVADAHEPVRASRDHGSFRTDDAARGDDPA